MKKKIDSSRLTPKLKKQEMDDVFTEFYRLDQIQKNEDQDMQNYIVIRLVTIIEQFFRKIVEKRIKDGKTKNIQIEITLNINDFMNAPQISKELLISSNYSFQNMDAITNTMKQYDVVNPFQNEEISKSFQELFKLRHDTVHTVLSVNEEIDKYHTLIEDMIKRVLNNVYSDDAYFYLSRGNVSQNFESHSDAIKYYDKAIELKPGYADAYNNKGISLAELGCHKEAIQCFDKAIELKPDGDFLYAAKGISLAELECRKEAIQCFDKAIELKPDEVIAYNHKGRVLAGLGCYKEAIQCFDKIINLKPDSGSAYTNKGVSFAELRRHKEAIRYFDKAIELNPEDIRAYANKGRVLAELEHHKEAMQCFDKIIEMRPDNARAYSDKGILFEKLGLYNDAKKYFDKANELKPDDPDNN